MAFPKVENQLTSMHSGSGAPGLLCAQAPERSLSMAASSYRCNRTLRLEAGQSHHLKARSQRGQGRPRASAFYLLVSTLAATDLLGKCSLSPIVLAAYAHNRSLVDLWALRRPSQPARGGPSPDPLSRPLCQLFAFLMAFFGLASTVLLLAMALECWLSLGQPYFYERPHQPPLGRAAHRRGSRPSAPSFCALPLLGFGGNSQYCPGTWCFIRMAGNGRLYSVLYASLLGLLVLAVGLCNLGSMASLYRMARRQPPRRTQLIDPRRSGAPSRPLSSGRTEELGQLVLLALMTALFTVCSLPLIIRAYIGAFAPDANEAADLTALRFFSVNSIVDPWVFIIFRTSIFRSLLQRFSRRLSLKKDLHSQDQLLGICQRKESNDMP
ncbi:LOW QUALITY PROTEIN: prostaglandin D2 receptor-like [Erythrolamprus reginae]|uniref:LOW QUALITY PROTEIN: prostaglandin D2 receptor-like n=1 Tax=Erythrolamprus reginae TaxID=121349 RepID=UPI00396C90BF